MTIDYVYPVIFYENTPLQINELISKLYDDIEKVSHIFYSFKYQSENSWNNPPISERNFTKRININFLLQKISFYIYFENKIYIKFQSFSKQYME